VGIMFDEEIKKLEQLEKIYKKIDLLERKRERMGIDEEEIVDLMKMKDDYYKTFDGLMSKILETIIETSMSSEGKKELKKIQNLVPWSGKKEMSIDDFESILDAGKSLTDKDIMQIEKSLEKIHMDVFKGFELFCRTQVIFDALDEIGKSLTISSQGGIEDVVRTIDDIFKNFGEIFGIDLPEIKLVFY
jgi:hypothetical protein